MTHEEYLEFLEVIDGLSELEKRSPDIIEQLADAMSNHDPANCPECLKKFEWRDVSPEERAERRQLYTEGDPEREVPPREECAQRFIDRLEQKKEQEKLLTLPALTMIEKDRPN